MVSQRQPTPTTSNQSGVGAGKGRQAAGAGTSPEIDGARSRHQSGVDVSLSRVVVGPVGPSALGGPRGRANG
eukprot:3035352-Lingulodinium_polyedra.AAC.1